MVVRSLGASIGAAWMTTTLDKSAKEHFTFLTAHVDAASATLWEQHRALAEGPLALAQNAEATALAALQLRISTQALLRAFNEGFMMLAVAFALSMAFILAMRSPATAAATAKPR
jgi:MFS transporter, DHA2 family, multidrug resistance protein